MSKINLKSEYGEIKDLINKPFVATYSPMFSPKAHYISQHQVGYISNKNGYQALITKNLATCIGLAIHNPDTDKIALAHIDALTTGDSIEKIFDNMREPGKTKLHISMVGGNKNDSYSCHLVKAITDFINLNKSKNFIIKYTNCLPAEKESLLATQELFIDTNGNLKHTCKGVEFDYIPLQDTQEWSDITQAGETPFALTSLEF